MPESSHGPIPDVAAAGAAASGWADVRLVVYDLDGTLLDAFQDIRDAVNHALTGAGVEPLGLEQVKGAVGDGAATLLRRCLGPERADLYDAVYPIFMKFYANNPDPKQRLYPGVPEALRAMRRLGRLQAILTNKPQSVTEMSCRRLGLADLVDGVWGGREGAPLKPDPESLRAVARHFDVLPAQCAMVGDYRADFEVARSSGARMIGVTWGLWNREQILAQRPDAVIDAIGELPKLLGAP
jgi:phosphoglycolate phosphatase